MLAELERLVKFAEVRKLIAGLSGRDLTLDKVGEVTSVLGIKVPNEAVQAAMEVIKADDPALVEAWLLVPANQAKLKRFLTPSQPILSVRCPHCFGLFELQAQDDEGASVNLSLADLAPVDGVYKSLRCPHCQGFFELPVEAA